MRILILSIIVLSVATVGNAAVGVSASGSGNGAGATTCTISSLTVGSGEVLYVGWATRTPTAVPTGLKWDAAGVNETVTAISNRVFFSSTGDFGSAELVSPTAKTADVTITWAGGVDSTCFAASLSGVIQQTTEGENFDGGDGSVTFTNTSAANMVLCLGVDASVTCLDPGGAETELRQQCPGGVINHGSMLEWIEGPDPVASQAYSVINGSPDSILCTQYEAAGAVDTDMILKELILKNVVVK